MIDLDALTKSFPGSPRPAVDRLTLTIPAGEVCVLIGPSGCGKTTTMRMINRLIEPDSGTIMVEGRNILHVDPVELRRSIGYVIQQVGLFPHWSIADNIATVPRLLGWEPTRTGARVDELLSLVGMEPAQYRHRFPRELSGGQKQRVGVARALAANPPVMLMDEPFGALDPITRTRLQSEFLRILRGLRKTIVFVTHDIDEAIKMGDRIAIMKDGELMQYDTPEAILARPVDAFVDEFVGSDRALKRLALIPAADIMAAGGGGARPRIAADASARDALAAMLAAGADGVTLVDENGAPRGTITLAAMRKRLTAHDEGSFGELRPIPIK
jgi:osmoprotectant transport system ATP-binding protein